MNSALAGFTMAVVVAASLTPIVRAVASRVGVTARPGGRHVHQAPTPRLGGIAIVVAFFVPLGVLFVLETDIAEMFFAEPSRMVGLSVAGVAVAALGALDDIRGVKAWHKLWLQIAAAGFAFICGYKIDAVTLPLLGRLDMGVFAAPVTILWIVAIINALNLIDGLDGLAGGVAFFACAANFVVAAVNGSPLVMLLSAVLGGAVVGFLLYNFNPASIFMGDSGSMFLGFALATTSLLGAAAKSSTTVAILVPILALGLPIMDTLFAMVRRILERRPVFSPDRGHIHHRLLDLGLTHRRAVLLLYGLSVLMAVGAIAVATGRDWQVGAVLASFSLVAAGLVRSLGYFDSVLAAKGRKRELSRSELTEGLREAVPVAIVGLLEATNQERLHFNLTRFAEDSGLVALRLTSSAGRVLFDWSRGDGPQRERVGRHYASKDGVLYAAWLADGSILDPAADVLVQLVADGCCDALRRVECSAASSDPRRAAG